MLKNFKFKIKNRVKYIKRDFYYLRLNLFRKIYIYKIFLFLSFFYRKKPLSKVFGLDRGMPIDRYYINKFLEKNEKYIRGRVLEIGDNSYTILYGKEKVFKSDVLHVFSGNPKATIVSDLSEASNIESNIFDCIILTQTLPFIYDLRSTIKNLHRILKPGGILLLTVPGISQISRYDMDKWGDYWRFTNLSIERLLKECFLKKDIELDICGNVLIAISYLHGLAFEDLCLRDLNLKDPDYQFLITAKVFKN